MLYELTLGTALAAAARLLPVPCCQGNMLDCFLFCQRIESSASKTVSLCGLGAAAAIFWADVANCQCPLCQMYGCLRVCHCLWEHPPPPLVQERQICLFCRLHFTRCTACDDVEQIINVLIPLVIGKFLREAVPGAKDWVKRWKVRLSLTSSCMLIMVVWQTLSRAQDNLTSVKFVQILWVIAAGIALHAV